MNTTAIFIELLVVGVGALLWVLMLLLIIFGWDWIKLDLPDSWAVLFPAVSIIYVVGIVYDRISDKIFDKKAQRIRKNYFKDLEDYYRKKTLVCHESETLRHMVEYAKSRLRICRSWTITAGMLFVLFPLFVGLRFSFLQTWEKIKLASLGALLFGLLLWGTYYAWKKLTETLYLKIKEQTNYSFLNKEGQDSLT